MHHDPLLDTIPKKDRERLAIHNLAKLNDARHRIAALLECEFDDAEAKAILVRETYEHEPLGG